MSDKLLTSLKKATKGLLYPSEYDSPLEPFVWEDAENSAAVVRRQAGQPATARCRTISADEFFGELEDVEGFSELYLTLQKALTDLKVYRFGDANVTVYVIGRAQDGRLAGFKTLSVET